MCWIFQEKVGLQVDCVYIWKVWKSFFSDNRVSYLFSRHITAYQLFTRFQSHSRVDVVRFEICKFEYIAIVRCTYVVSTSEFFKSQWCLLCFCVNNALVFIIRSYEPPKRDEERETERKAKARRARETRRSTQVCYLSIFCKCSNVFWLLSFVANHF